MADLTAAIGSSETFQTLPNLSKKRTPSVVRTEKSISLEVFRNPSINQMIAFKGENHKIPCWVSYHLTVRTPSLAPTLRVREFLVWLTDCTLLCASWNKKIWLNIQNLGVLCTTNYFLNLLYYYYHEEIFIIGFAFDICLDRYLFEPPTHSLQEKEKKGTKNTLKPRALIDFLYSRANNFSFQEVSGQGIKEY